MKEREPFVVPLSLVGRSENISDKTVRRILRRLEADGEVEVQRTPTGRGLLNISGYQRLRKEILTAANHAA